MRLRFPVFALLVMAAGPVSAQAPAPAAESEQAILMRSVLEAMRANAAAVARNTAALESFSNRLERVEAATRTVPPSVEGLRTDVIAIRAGLDRLVAGAGQRRAAATLRFTPFACGNEGEAACVASACKSVGYANGIAVAVNRTGAGAAVRPTSVAEATCYD